MEAVESVVVNRLIEIEKQIYYFKTEDYVNLCKSLKAYCSEVPKDEWVKLWDEKQPVYAKVTDGPKVNEKNWNYILSIFIKLSQKKVKKMETARSLSRLMINGSRSTIQGYSFFNITSYWMAYCAGGEYHPGLPSLLLRGYEQYFNLTKVPCAQLLPGNTPKKLGEQIIDEEEQKVLKFLKEMKNSSHSPMSLFSFVEKVFEKYKNANEDSKEEEIKEEVYDKIKSAALFHGYSDVLKFTHTALLRHRKDSDSKRMITTKQSQELRSILHPVLPSGPNVMDEFGVGGLDQTLVTKRKIESDPVFPDSKFRTTKKFGVVTLGAFPGVPFEHANFY